MYSIGPVVWAGKVKRDTDFLYEQHKIIMIYGNAKLIIRRRIASIDYLEKNETVDYTKKKKNECKKLTRHCVDGKCCQLCEKLRFDHPDKSHMHKKDYLQEREMNKILWDFLRQTDPLIRQSEDQTFIGFFSVLVKHRVKIFGFCLIAEKQNTIKVTVIPFIIGTLGTVFNGVEKRLGKLEMQRRIEELLY